MEELAKRNIESWAATVEFYETFFVGGSYEEVLRPVLSVVKQIAQSERAQSFQAGHSIYNLIISTVDYFGLFDKDYYVFVTPLVENSEFVRGQFQVQYRQIVRNEAFESLICDSSTLRSGIEELLDRLWADTKGRKSVT